LAFKLHLTHCFFLDEQLADMMGEARNYFILKALKTKKARKHAGF
jgi:hypothetical protein